MSQGFLSALVCISLGHLASAACPRGWVSFRESCYMFALDEKESWAAAQTICMLHGSHLVEIESQAENDFLAAQYKNRSSSVTGGRSVWLGADELAVEGEWQWISSGISMVQAGYQNWSPGQPDNLNSYDHRHENCLDAFPSMQWNDEECSQGNSFICETVNEEAGTFIG